MKFKSFYLLCGITASFSSFTFGQAFENGFESYADQAAYNAAWTADNSIYSAAILGYPMTLVTDPSNAYNGNKYLSHNSNTYQRSGIEGFSVQASDANPVVCTYYTRVNAASSAMRSYIQLTAGSKIINFGVFNSGTPAPGTNNWQVRTVGLTGDGWITITNPAGYRFRTVEGTNVYEWHKIQLVIQETKLEIFQNDVSIYEKSLGNWGTTIPSFTKLQVGFYPAIGTGNTTIPAVVDYDEFTIKNAPSSVADWNVY